MDRDHRTRRNFIFTALSAMGGALGVAACQKTTTQFEGSSLDRPSTPDDATGQTQAVQSVSENASAQKTAQALDGSAPMPGRSLGNTNLVMPVLGLGGSASPLTHAPDRKLKRSPSSSVRWNWECDISIQRQTMAPVKNF